MASRFSLLLLPTLALVLLFSLSAEARPGVHFHPCNTVVFSAYSFSLLRPQNPNPSPNSNLRRPEFVAVFAELRPDAGVLHHRHSRFFLPHHQHERIEEPQRPDFPFALGFSSLKDRTKDILNVVASLLLGAACGALTAGTMYLIWSLFNHRNGSYRSMDGFSSDDDDDNDDDEDIFNPKKKGDYVAIPAAKAVDSAAPVVVAVTGSAPAKESA